MPGPVTERGGDKDMKNNISVKHHISLQLCLKLDLQREALMLWFLVKVRFSLVPVTSDNCTNAHLGASNLVFSLNKYSDCFIPDKISQHQNSEEDAYPQSQVTLWAHFIFQGRVVL